MLKTGKVLCEMSCLLPGQALERGGQQSTTAGKSVSVAGKDTPSGPALALPYVSGDGAAVPAVSSDVLGPTCPFQG